MSTMSMKSAVCLLIPLGISKCVTAEDEKYVAISRRKNPNLWGLPGGKVDPGESSLQAILRETQEEIGMAIPADELEPLYCGVCPGKGPSDTYWVTTYLWNRAEKTLDLKPEEGLTTSFKSEFQLTSPHLSPFFDYNIEVFEAYRAALGYRPALGYRLFRNR
jgi:8-oxo-dGTP pyrophosphatase MutT (NUDIX family)